MSTERCATHPDRDSVATCARCGSFLCGECRVPDSDPPICTSCDARLGRAPLLRHVPLLAIVLIIHGVLTAGLGAFMLVFGGFYVAELASIPTTGEGDDAISGIVLLALVLIGVTHVVPGALQVLAGYRMRTFRGRGVALLALTSGLATSLGCYCLPTSIGLLVWGCIVLLNSEVARRFASPGTDAS